MNKNIIALFSLFLSISSVHSDNGQYLKLAYVVEVPGVQTQTSIHPSYIWADENILFIPIQTKISDELDYPLQTNNVLLLDLVTKRSIFGASFSSIRGLEVYRLSKDNQLLLSIIDDYSDSINGNAPSTDYSDFLFNTSNLSLIKAEFAAVKKLLLKSQPVDLKEIPEALRVNPETVLYHVNNGKNGNKIGIYDWELWNEDIVALGKPIDSNHSKSHDMHDLRLYSCNGDVKFIFPNLSIIPDNTTAIPTMLQTSPKGQYLMVSPQNLNTENIFEIGRKNVLLIYEIVDKESFGKRDTVLFTIPPTFSSNFEIGDSINLEWRTIDGSSLSTGRF